LKKNNYPACTKSDRDDKEEREEEGKRGALVDPLSPQVTLSSGRVRIKLLVSYPAITDRTYPFPYQGAQALRCEEGGECV
jgi:hypothetical protein